MQKEYGDKVEFIVVYISEAHALDGLRRAIVQRSPQRLAHARLGAVHDHVVAKLTGALRAHLLEVAPHMRLVIMGVILLLVMRFAPRGLIPEIVRR